VSLHFVAREGRAASLAPLPPYPAPEQREDLFLILGKQYPWTSPERATTPTWLTIPERGLYTGLLVLSAIGSGKTSACLYPYVEQLLAYPAGDSTRRAAGLVLEVKRDVCRQVPDILARHGRAEDYMEVSLNSPYRYNPLHNDLDDLDFRPAVARIRPDWRRALIQRGCSDWRKLGS